MDKLLQDIGIIIKETNNNINEKIFNINYLEKLKYLLIDKIKELDISAIDKNLKLNVNKVLENNLRHNLLVNVDNNVDSISKLNALIDNPSLFLVLRGSLSIEIINKFNKKKVPFLNLYTNTGIILNKDSITNQLVSKDSLIIIISILDEKNIEKN